MEYKMSFLRIMLLAASLFSLGLVAQPVQLDTSFGIDGFAFLDVDTNYYSMSDMALQDDGKIIVTGRWQTGSGWDVYIIRTMPNGNIDESFGFGGVVLTDLGTYWDDGRALAIQEDGKILVAAEFAEDGMEWTTAVIRYNSDGSLDSSFGTGGIATGTFGYSGSPSDIAVGESGFVLVAGATWDYMNFSVSRYTSNGIPDSTFHSDGIFHGTCTYGFNVADKIILQEDGKIVLGVFGGQSGNYDVGLVRLTADGQYDNMFGNGGKRMVHVSAADDVIGGIGVQSDGSYVLAGRSDVLDSGIFVARISNDGLMDMGWANNGIAKFSITTGEEGAMDLIVQPDDGILLACHAQPLSGNLEVGLLRLSAGGQLDPQLGSSGVVLTPIPGNQFGTITAAGVQLDAGVIVAVNGGQYPLLLRYLPGESIGIHENRQGGRHLSIAPNPATDRITIVTYGKATSLVNMEILDATGRIVASVPEVPVQSLMTDISRLDMNVEQLVPGLYTVVLHLREGCVTGKFIKTG